MCLGAAVLGSPGFPAGGACCVTLGKWGGTGVGVEPSGCRLESSWEQPGILSTLFLHLAAGDFGKPCPPAKG